MEGNKDQSPYRIAEYILYNRLALRSLIAGTYIKAKTLPSQDAKILVEDRLVYKLAECGAFDIDKLEAAFADERVRIILDKYYLMDFMYEH